VDKLKEIDEKRQSDKTLIVKSIQELSKLPVVAAPVTPPAPAVPVGPTYEYTVQPGDNLGGIVRAYNTEFEKQGLKSIRISQIEKANPGLDPDRILVGQVIRIPIPDKN
jgi:LysM repeat protein